MNKLLSRDEFRQQVFNRDNNLCVICKQPAVDAHHIIERKLWPDEGYYINNGASLCEVHHKLAETNHIPPQAIRLYAGIKETIQPPSFISDWDYDKWGNRLIKWNQSNTGGEIKYTKYPSTSYFSFSPGGTGEKDRMIANIKEFVGVPIGITYKMDGSNVKLTTDYVAARNGIVAQHKSFDLLKAFHKKFCHLIPKDIEIYGEWLYAKHSIHYKDLKAYLQIFGVFDTRTNLWQSWGVVECVADIIGFPTVPVVCREQVFKTEGELISFIVLEGDRVIEQGHEGLVIRNIYPFHDAQFGRFMAKYVRKDHVQTDEHWSQVEIIKNEVKK